MNEKQQTGRWGEELAAAILENRGWEVLERNWRPAPGKTVPVGELDLICRTPDGYVICEVKTRASTEYGHPFEAIVPEKARRLHLLAREWTRTCGLVPGSVRIDAVAVTGRLTDFRFEQLEGVA